MREASNSGKWQVSATATVLVLCCLWIQATTWAWWRTHLGDDALAAVASSHFALCNGIALCWATVVIIVFLPSGPVLKVETGEVWAGLLFAALAAAHFASESLSPWDTVASFFVLLGICAAVRTKARWLVATLLGVACGCSPLAAGALVVLVRSGKSWSRQIAALLSAGAIAIATGVLIGLVSGRPWTEAMDVSSKVARVGPSFLWTLVAEWADMVMPVIVLALLAISERLFAPRDAHGSMGGAPMAATSGDAVMVWLLINTIAGICMPRVLVTHGLLFVLPAFLLVPAGWRVLRQLPFDRSQWTLSLFSGICYLLPLLLLWVPLRKTAELIMAALWVP